MDGNYKKKLVVVMMVLMTIPLRPMLIIVQADDHSPPSDARRPSPFHPPSYPFSSNFAFTTKLICPSKCWLQSVRKIRRDKKRRSDSRDEEDSKYFKTGTGLETQL